jgi:cytochrome c biogenesis protein CcmG/thiol:disulfide interchange protein DsbE
VIETPTQPEQPSPPDPVTRRSRAPLWTVAVFAAAVMAIAAWQIQQGGGDAPTASEAFNESAGQVAASAAPSFNVPLLTGGRFDLADHLSSDGRPVLLNLWASWCIPCRNEMPFLDDAAPLYPNVLFVGVAVNDSRANAENFATEIGVTYPIAFDTEGEVVAGYPAPAMPVTYVIGSDGTVTGRYFGELTADRIDELLGPVS